jgi:hypothetical protein
MITKFSNFINWKQNRIQKNIGNKWRYNWSVLQEDLTDLNMYAPPKKKEYQYSWSKLITKNKLFQNLNA